MNWSIGTRSEELNMDDSTTNLRCIHCNRRKPDVTTRRDPFMWEVWDEEWLVPMCDSCEENRSDEV